MNVHRPRSRDSQEVLERAPWFGGRPKTNPNAIDIVAQLEELAELVDRGLLSHAEFDRQKRKVLDL